MAQWGKRDRSSDAPKHQVHPRGKRELMNTANAYMNVTPGSYSNNQTVGIFAVSNAEVAVTKGLNAPGWVKLTQGTGPITGATVSVVGSGFGNLAVGTFSNGSVNCNFTVNTNGSGALNKVTMLSNGRGFINASAVGITYPANAVNAVTYNGGAGPSGDGYANGEVVTVSNGEVNAVGAIVTNGSGRITAVTFSSRGRGFPSAGGAEVAIATAAGTNANVVVSSLYGGTGATIVPTMGGRAGRKNYETLVAVHISTSNASDDAWFPDS